MKTRSGLVIAAMAVCAALAIERRASGPEDDLSDLRLEFRRVMIVIEEFQQNHGVYPRTLEEAWNCPGAPRYWRRPDFPQWNYLLEAKTGKFTLQHKQHGEIHNVDPSDPEARKAALASGDMFFVDQIIFGLTSAPGDIDFLIQVLRSAPSSEARGDAVREIERICPGDQKRSLLREALLDPEADVWTMASRMLAMAERASSGTIFQEWSVSPDPVRRRQGARGLYGIDSAVRLAPLDKLLDDPDADIRLSAAVSLASPFGDQLACPEEIQAKLRAGMAGKDGAFRLVCARAAATFGMPAAIPILLESLGKPQTSEDRLEDLQALRSIKTAEATAALRRFLKDEDVGTCAAYELASREYPQHDADLLSLLDDSSPERLATAARLSVKAGKGSQPEMIRRLVGLLDHSDPDVRFEAAQVLGASACCDCPWHLEATPLGALKDARAVRALAERLNGDEDDRVRVAAAMALCSYQDPTTSGALLAALSDTARWLVSCSVGGYAAWALHEMKVPIPAGKLVDALLHSHPNSVRPFGLAASGHPQAEEIGRMVRAAIPGQLESQDERQVLGALCALGFFPLPEAEKKAMDLSRHPCPYVRAAATRALWDNHSPEWRARLAELARDPSLAAR